MYLPHEEFKAAMILPLSAYACPGAKTQGSLYLVSRLRTVCQNLFIFAGKIRSVQGRRCCGRGRFCGCNDAMLRRLLFCASSNQRIERASTERVERGRERQLSRRAIHYTSNGVGSIQQWQRSVADSTPSTLEYARPDVKNYLRRYFGSNIDGH